MKIKRNMGLVFVTDMPCLQCCSLIPRRVFVSREPLVGLCSACTKLATREDYGFVRSGLSASKSVRFVMGEALPGKSTGKPRKFMIFGNAENANGLWDNLTRAMEDGPLGFEDTSMTQE